MRATPRMPLASGATAEPLRLVAFYDAVQIHRRNRAIATISGMQPGEALLAIDFRPATGQLYGLGSTSRLYTIDSTSGAATAIGAGFGYGVTWLVEQVPLPINGIFKTDHFIVVRDPNHYLAAIATAVVMVMIASLIPARRAARLEPGDIVRGTAQ